MNELTIEVIYATPSEQRLVACQVPPDTTIAKAIAVSGILSLYPEIDLNKQKVGVFGKICLLDTLVKAGDRIEIYRPLTIDPKSARRLRAHRKLG